MKGGGDVAGVWPDALPAGGFADMMGAPLMLTIGGIITITVTLIAMSVPKLRNID